MEEVNIKLIVAYDGTNYHGFQRQKNKVSVQEEVEKAIETLYKRKISINAAGRTDAGVHARGQVINFKTGDDKIPIDRLSFALNSNLPSDIVVKDAEKEEPNFDARKDAKGKKYLYYCYKSTQRDPFLRNFAYFINKGKYKLDYENMQKACSKFLGTHDFTAFCASGTSVKNKIREIYSFEMYHSEENLIFEIRGSGFLYKMVRLMVGTVIQVGKGKIGANEVERILEEKDKSMAGPTIASHGLYLEEVYY